MKRRERRGPYRVKELAEMAGVSVRTLHHYDEIGLLNPSARSAAGYRLYSDDDVLRLQQILIGRELGLPLEGIRRSLDDPRFDRRSALRKQRDELLRRAQRTDAMIRAVDVALAMIEMKTKKRGEAPMDMQSLFDGFDPSQYEDEARERWGQTDAYKESMKRTKSYTPEDWNRFKAEQAEIYANAVKLVKSGKPPSGSEAMDVAERHRLSIDRWFYPCDSTIHCGLASLYETDSRFAKNIDKFGEGLTTFLVAAIRANAERRE